MRASELELPKGVKVYLDMDGVLANFFEEYAKLAGVKNYRDVPPAKVDPTLDKMVGTDFFARLPKFPVTDKIVDVAIQAAGSYGIISSPLRGDFKNSEQHKREWIKKHLNPQPTEIFITPNKEKHAVNADGTPNVLIDDRGSNITAWEKAGGIGVKFQADEDSLKVILDGLNRARRIGSGEEKHTPQDLKSRDLGKMIATKDDEVEEGRRKKKRKLKYRYPVGGLIGSGLSSNVPMDGGDGGGESIQREGDLAVPSGSVKGVVVDLIADKIQQTNDYEQISQWLKFIVGKTLKPRGKLRYTITDEDILEALSFFKEEFDDVAEIDLANALDTMAKNAENGQRLKDVFIMRNKHRMTFKQIGGEIGTGTDRARQVYLRSLRKLKFLLKDYVGENFADGKRKGKSRPGRVKKAGASCKGSVTDLRAKAKKYSGEKGKMYHWCANMKGGKK